MGLVRMVVKFLCFLLFSIVLGLIGGGCNGEEIDSVPAPMEKSEQEALFSAIQGFVGKWWNGSDLYPDPCGLTPIQGVSCDLFGDYWYVISLNIGPVHDNSLRCAQNVEFSKSLFQLKYLKYLSFFNCFDSPLHPMVIPTETWGALADSLESLEFRSNPGLVGQIPFTFGGLIKLQSLVLLQNGLTGEIPAHLGSLMNLKRLVLSQNKITSRIPDSLGGLSDLLILDLNSNSISGPLPLTIGGMTSLLMLDISNNQLEGKIPQQIGNLKNLTLVDLSNNRISGGLTKSLQEMTSLEQLVLSGNPIGGNLMTLDWHYLIGLNMLGLSNTSLTGGIPDSLTQLKRLRFLGLNDNNLGGEIPLKLASMPNISAIYLNGNNMTGELQFPQEFYEKMKGKFGAWNNTNLCYPTYLTSSSYVPFGVKPCQKETTLNETNLHQKGNQNLSHSMSMASLGFSIYATKELFCIVLVVELSILGFFF